MSQHSLCSLTQPSIPAIKGAQTWVVISRWDKTMGEVGRGVKQRFPFRLCHCFGGVIAKTGGRDEACINPPRGLST